MKGFAKRISALAICMLLLCTLIVSASAATADACPGDCDHQAAIDTTHYTTLAEAIANAQDGSTVTLLTDVTLTESLTVSASITLNLNQHTLTGHLADQDQAVVHFTKDSTLRRGKLIASSGSALLVSDCLVTIEKSVRIEGCGTVPTLRVTASKDKESQVDISGRIIGKGPAPVVETVSEKGNCQVKLLEKSKLTAQENPAIDFDSAGELEISGGTVKTKKDAICVTLAKKRQTKLSVTGGSILSAEGEAFAIEVKKGAKAPAPFVTGGTFQAVPTAYVPDYAQIRENKNDTYTVISEYILTFKAGGGTGSMEPINVQCGSTITLPQCAFTPEEGMDFAGWDIKNTIYAAGESYTPTGNVTVTAKWKTHEHTGGSATCLKQAQCEACGESYGKLGSHNLTYTGGYAPSCSEGGMNAHSVCALCGSCFVDSVEITEYSLYIPALGHDWQEAEGQPATCTEAGIHPHSKCKTCGQLQLEGRPVTEEDLPIPAAGHSLEAVEATQATCTEAGIRAHERCTVCDGLFVKGESVTADTLTTSTVSHVLSDWTGDEHYHWKTCVDCGETFRQNGHSDFDQDSLCDDCGYELPQSQAGSPAGGSFSWLFLLPMVAAVAISVLLIVKKRK